MAKYFNSKIKGVNCRSIDSILYNWCIVSLRKLKVLGREHKEIRNEYRDDVNSKVRQEASNEVYSSEMIADKLKELVEDNELVF
jgi:hypothetical protein